MTTQVEGHTVSKETAEKYTKVRDQEIEKAEGSPRPVLIIVMGPASCGKSTIGHDLSHALSLPFIDGDTLHPQHNIDKMSAGTPLTDEDRLPWLALIRTTAEKKCKEEWEDSGYKIKKYEDGGLGRPGVIIACSALKKWYRDILRGEVRVEGESHKDDEGKEFHPSRTNLHTLFLYCHGSPETLKDRITARKGHFMGTQMLDSQLKTLEDPRGEEGVAWVDIKASIEEVGKRAVEGVRGLIGELKEGE